MSERKHGLGLLGLLALTALSVMVFASAAQAVVPRFLTGGILAAALTIQGEQEGRGTLSIPALNTEINCEKVTLDFAKIVNSLEAEAALLYQECTVLELKSPLGELPCVVIDARKVSPLPHISVFSAWLKPIEFGGGTFGVLASTLGEFVNFKSGTGCPLPLKTEIKGSVCAKITSGNNTLEPLIQSSEAIQKASGCGDKLLYGANESFVAASTKLWTLGKVLILGVALD